MELPVTTDLDEAARLLRPGTPESEVRHALARMPFNDAYDLARYAAATLSAQGRAADAVERIEAFDRLVARTADEEHRLLDIHAALMQVLTALHITRADIPAAMTTAAATLQLLAQRPKRKDEPFLSVLAPLLHDISIIHSIRGEFRQAEREIGKCVKILDRLAKQNPARYSSPQMIAISAATRIYRSRSKQSELLTHRQTAIESYMEQLRSGDDSAATMLIDTLAEQGRTLAQMGKHREAVHYFTRALRYLGQANDEFTLMHLRLSIDLGEALLHVKATADKGVHLLNTMLHKASRMQAEPEHNRIRELLATPAGSNDILGFWHKIFPR